MPFDVCCPRCSATLRAPNKLAGKKVKCPKCSGVIALPGGPNPPKPPPPSVPKIASTGPPGRAGAGVARRGQVTQDQSHTETVPPLKSAAKAPPKDESLWQELVVTARDSGQHEQAVELAKQGIREQPRSVSMAFKNRAILAARISRCVGCVM